MGEYDLYEDISEEEEEVFDCKKLKGYVWTMLRISACVAILTLGIMEAGDIFMGFAMSLLALLLGAVLFIFILNYMRESEHNFLVIKKISWAVVVLCPLYIVFHLALTRGLL